MPGLHPKLGLFRNWADNFGGPIIWNVIDGNESPTVHHHLDRLDPLQRVSLQGNYRKRDNAVAMIASLAADRCVGTPGQDGYQK
jgi:hypothetical protein